MQGLGDSGGKSSLAMVYVTDGADVTVCLGAFKLLFAH
jgi:hypothetical protein